MENEMSKVTVVAANPGYRIICGHEPTDGSVDLFFSDIVAWSIITYADGDEKEKWESVGDPRWVVGISGEGFRTSNDHPYVEPSGQVIEPHGTTFPDVESYAKHLASKYEVKA